MGAQDDWLTFQAPQGIFLGPYPVTEDVSRLTVLVEADLKEGHLMQLAV